MNKIFNDLTCGEYRLKVNITALSDTHITLYGNHRQFLFKELAVQKGKSLEKNFAISIKNASFQKQEDYNDTQLTLTGEGDFEGLFQLEKASFPTIYTLGDSTVCNQENWEKTPMERCGGWGQALPMFLSDRYAVSNHAEQGTHTRNCLDCHLIPVLNQIKKGDKVLCQFGHNDQKQEWLKPFGGYMENLMSIGEKVLSKGGEFIICTPINRLIYVDGKLNNYLDDYRDGAMKAAEKLGVKTIDLHTFTSNEYLKLKDEAENLFYHSPELDRTHPNDYGAIKIARFVSENLE